jgi:hypothetical protein
MKKEYIIIMKLETESPEPDQIIPGDEEEQKHIDRLIKELYRQNKAICELYSMLTLTELLDDNHKYFVDEKLTQISFKSELEILEPVIQALPGDSQEFLRWKFAPDSSDNDDMYNKIMSQLDDLIMTNISFFESLDYSKKKDKRNVSG